MSRAPTCAHPRCDERVVRTGSRGPWPDCCPAHRGERQREQWRKRKRKSRGAQWVIAEFESDRNADRELREYSIVDLEDSPGELWLKGERDRAVEMAESERTRKLRECETLPDGYLEGGNLWDGLGQSPPYLPPGHEVWPCGKEGREPPELSPKEQRCDALMRRNRGLV
jgi:hypothetical protein